LTNGIALRQSGLMKFTSIICAIALFALSGCDDTPMTPEAQAAWNDAAYNVGVALGGGSSGSAQQPKRVECRTWGSNTRCEAY